VDAIRDEYLKVLEYCEARRDRLPEYLLRQSRRYYEGLYADYGRLLDAMAMPLAGKTVVDFGCKFGHLIPLLLARGAREAVGIDVDDDHVRAGAEVFGALYPNARVVRSEDGLVPLQSGTVDVIIMIEVISHVNPSFLDTVWSEASRVLRTGGILFISDGNNRANAEVRATLVELYDKWENGPDGARTDRDIVTTPFLERRRKFISERHPALPAEKVEHLALNTSGLFGGLLARVVDRYVASGELHLRPYRRGACPVSPYESGVVMERAFFPQQLEMALVEHGFDAKQIVPQPSYGRRGLLGPAKDLYVWMRHRLKTVLNPEWYRSAHDNFQIMAVRK
jgi:SAM-dependent methyltransferase